MKLRRIILTISFGIIAFTSSMATIPGWVTDTPDIPTIGTFSFKSEYGIDIDGKVYIAVLNSYSTTNFAGSTIRSVVLGGGGAGWKAVADLTVTGGDVGVVLEEIFEGLEPSHAYTVYFTAAESDVGDVQATSVRFNITTDPCPTAANTYLGFSTVTGNNCVNLGISKSFNIYTYHEMTVPPQNPSNILKGAQWEIDWGDGSANWTFTSTYDNDGPGALIPPPVGFEFANMSHQYPNHDTCFYDIKLTVVQPGVCASIGGINQEFMAKVWAPDDDIWGNGEMLLVNDEDDSPDTIRICEGNESRILLRDASTWDCDGNFIDDTDPFEKADVNANDRIIQFTYGRSPDGTIAGENTITGTVNIGASGTAEAGVSGYYSDTMLIPAPYPVVNPETQSDTIVIPPSCQAGEIFKVYVKDWNQCNPFTGAMTPASNSDYVYDEIVILVVDAPPAPTAPDVAVCVGDDETLTVLSVPVGNFYWYYDGLKNNPIGVTGPTYDPNLGVVGIDTFYVADLETTGDLCEGPPDTVVLKINPIPSIPTISVSDGSTPMCFDGSTTVELTASADGDTDSWIWYEDGGPMGETAQTIVLGPAVQDHDYTVGAVGIADTYCESNPSAPQNVTIAPLPEVDAGPATASFCTSAPYSTVGSYGGAASSVTWTTSGDGNFLDYTDPTTEYTPGINDISSGTVTLTLTTDDPSGPCTAVSDDIIVTVVEEVIVDAGNNIILCSTTPFVDLNGSISGDYISHTWSSDGDPGTLVSTGGLTPRYTHTPGDVADGSIIITLDVDADPVCADQSDNLTITLYEQPTASRTTPTDEICSDETYPVPGFSAGGDYSGISWSTNGTGDGTFTNGTTTSPTYNPGPTDQLGATVTLEMTAAGQGGCTDATASMDLTIVAAPTVDAGADMAYTCQTDPFVIDDATATNYSTLAWSGGGGGFAPGDDLNTTYTPGGADPGNDVVLTLTVQPTDVVCAAVFGTRILHVDLSPTSTNGGDQNICDLEDGTTATLTGNDPSGVGHIGEWLYVDDLIFFEGFTGDYDGRMDGTYWDVDVSGCTLTPPNDFAEIQNNNFIFQDTDGTAIWETSDIALDAGKTYNLSVDVWENAPNLGNLDDIYVYYSTDGGTGLTEFSVGGHTQNDFAPFTATQQISGETKVRIVTTSITNGDSDQHQFDNVTIREETGQGVPTVTMTGVNTADAENLNQGANTFRWVVHSDNNMCTPATSEMTVNYDIKPDDASVGIDQEACETTGFTLTGNAATDGGTGAWSASGGFTGTIDSPNDPSSTLSNVNYGTHTLTWTISSALGICSTTDDDLLIINNEQPSPTITASSGPYCYLETVVANGTPNLGIGGSSVNTHAWTGSGAAYLTPSTDIEDPTFTAPENLGTTNVDYELTYTVTDDNGCVGSSAVKTITVYPRLVSATIGNDTSICNIEPMMFTFNIVGGTADYTINISEDGGDHIPYNITADAKYYEFTTPDDFDNSASPYLYTIDDITDANGCTTSTLLGFSTIIVGATLNSGDLTGGTDVCLNDGTNISVTVDGGAPPYTIVLDTTAAGGANPGQKTINNYVSGANIFRDLPLGDGHQYTLSSITDACGNTVTNPGNFTDDTETINVKPIPDASTTTPATQTICNNVTANITLNSTVNSTIFNYTVSTDPAVGFSWTAGKDPVDGSITDADANGTELFTRQFEHDHDESVEITYTITPVGPGATACDGTAITRTIIVEPTPVADFTNNDVTICNGDSPDIDVISPTVPTNPADLTFDYTVSSTNPPATGGTAYADDSGLSAPFSINALTGTLTNSSDEDITVTFTITPKLAGCSDGTPVDVDVVVEPTPAADFTNNDATICNGESPDIDVTSPTIPSNPADLTFDYTVSSTNPGATGGTAYTDDSGLTAPFSIDALTGILTNSSDEDITVTFTITPKLAGCSDGTPVDVVVVVEPTPVANFTNNDATICNGDSPDIDVTSPTIPSNPADLTFDYTVSSSNPGATGGSAYADDSGLTAPFSIDALTGTLTNSSDEDITVTFTITPKLAGCSDGTPVDVEVVVEPTPVANFTNNATAICNGESPDIDVTSPTIPSNPADLTFDYTVSSSNPGATGGSAYADDSGLSAPFNIDALTGTLTNSSDEDITVTFTITPKLAGCSDGSSVDVDVVVEPTPVANFTNNDATICNGDSPDIDITSPTIPSNPADLTFDYTVSSTNPGATGGSAYADDSGLTAPFSIDALTGTLTNSSDEDITVTFTITPKLAGCSDGTPVNVDVVVEPTPVANFSNNDATICNGESPDIDVTSPTIPSNPADLTFDYTVSSTNPGATGGTAYVDDSGQSAPFSIDSSTGTLTNSSNEDITVMFTITPKLAGCSDGTPVDVNVVIEPTPVVNFVNNDAIICNGESPDIDITSPTIPSNPADLTFDYTVNSTNPGATGGSAYADASGLTAPFSIDNLTGILTNSSDEDITVTFTITPKLAGCSDGTSVDVDVVVEPTPSANLTNNDPIICNGDNLAIDVSSSTDPTDIDDLTFSYTVQALDGTTLNGIGPSFGGTLDPADILDYPQTISDAVSHTTGDSVRVSITVTPLLAGCASGTPVVVYTIVEPTPDLLITNNASPVCDGANADIVISSASTPSDVTDLAFSMIIESTDPVNTDGTAYNIATGSDFNYNYTINGDLINNSDSPITVTYKATPKLASCASGAEENTTIVIEPTPVAGVTNNITEVCDGGDIDIDITSPTTASGIGGNDLIFDLTVSSTDPGATGGSAYADRPGLTFPYNLQSGNGNSVLTNSADTAITVTFTVTPSIGSCSGTPVVTQVVVFPTPVVQSASGEVCSGGIPSTTLVSNVSGTTYSWVIQAMDVNVTGNSGVDGSALFIGAVGAGDEMIDTLKNVSTSTGTITYRVTPINPAIWGSCTGPVEDVVITVYPEIRVTIAEAPLTFIAAGTTADLNGTIEGGTSTGYWAEIAPASTIGQGVFTPDHTTGGHAIGAVNFDPSLEQQDSGYVDIVLYSDDPAGPCGVVTDTIRIFIGENPTADADLDDTICEPDPVQYTLVGKIGGAGTSGAWTAPAWSGSFDAPAVAGPFDNGTPADTDDDYYTVTQTYTFDANDLPIPNNDTTITFTLLSNDPDGTGPVLPATDDRDVIVQRGPHTAAIGGGGKTDMCVSAASGQFYSVPFEFQNRYNWSVTGGVQGTDFTIQPGTGLINQNFIVLNFLTAGSYTLHVIEETPLVNTGTGVYCTGDEVTLDIDVYAPPTAIAGVDSSICQGGSIVLGGNPMNGSNPTATGGSGSYTYLWNPGLGLDDPSAAHPVASPAGTRTYYLTVTDSLSGCISPQSEVDITVNPLPTVYNFTGPAFYCFGEPGATLTLSGSQAGTDYQLYKDSNPEGAPVAGDGNPIDFSNLTTGSYNVTATDGNTCESNMNGTVSVVENPQIIINPDPPATTHVSCNAGSDGTINVLVSGGTPSYLYSAELDASRNFISSNLFTGKSAGTYNIIVQDSRLCEETTTATINEPPVLQITSLNMTQQVTCTGGTDGEAQVTAAGGTPAYAYQWYYDENLTNPIAGKTAATATGLAVGTYWVEVTDLNGCWVKGSVIITQIPALTVTFDDQTNVLCHDDATGAINVTVGGGTAPYATDWTGTDYLAVPFASTDEDLVNLKAGTYDLEVTDDNGCVESLATVTITQPADLAVSLVSATDVLCHDAATGSINVSASGGVVPVGGYVYAWSGNDYLGTPFNSTNEDLSGLKAGTYSLEVTDDNGCTVNLVPDVTINQPPDLTVTLTSQIDVLCHDAATGSIDVTAAGGVEPVGGYGYSWTGSDYLGNPYSSTNEDLTGLKAGSYNLTVTDDNGCTVMLATVTITQPADLTASLDAQTNVLCHDASTGEISITAAGGVVAVDYGYSWSGTDYLSIPFSSTDEDLTGLKAGSYTLTVTDDNGCTVILGPVNITQPSDLTVSLNSSVDVLCHDASTGAIYVTASGGVVPVGGYDYAWSGNDYLGTPFNSTNEDLTGLKAGTYSLEVTDDNGCTVDLVPDVTINQPPDLTVTLTSQTDVLCHDAATGSIDVTVTGGVEPVGGYTYAWTGTTYLSGFYSSNVEDPAGLKAGTYDLTVTDDNGCTVVLPTITITQPADLTLALDGQTNVLCHDDATGAINVTAAGGVVAVDYTYSWGGADYLGNPFSSADEDLTNLKAGSYSLTVEDDNGCTVNLGPVNITQPSDLAITLNATVDVLCHDASTGAIYVTVSGGVVPVGGYVFDWTGTDYLGNPFTSSSEDLTGLKAGTYNLEVTDDNGCTETLINVVIDQPADLTVTLDGQTNVLCYNDATGTIDVTVTGGVEPAGGYIFTWTGSDYLGTYFSSSSEDLTALKAGSYNLSVRDDNNCAVTLATVTITQPAQLTVVLDGQTNVLCHDDNTGAINVTAAGGVMPVGGYNYSWAGTDYLGNPFTSTDEDLTNLKAGTYNLTVTDDNGCTVFLPTVSVTQPADLTVTLNGQTNVLCHDAATGAIYVTVSGGVRPAGGYLFDWDGIDYLGNPYTSTDEDLTGLKAGSYDLEVNDDNGCIVTLATVTITQPADLTITLDSQTDVLCHDDATGAIDVTVAGGVMPVGGYFYQWSGMDYQGFIYSSTTEDPVNIKAGTYDLAVTDNNGCIVTLPTVTITQPADLTVTLDGQTNVLCHDDNTGAIDVTAAGGVMPVGGYDYLWTGTDYLGNPFSSTDEDLTGLKAGSYQLTVTDDNGCTVDLPVVVITQPNDLTVGLSAQTNVLCHDAATGAINVTVTGGVMPAGGYIYNWDGLDYLGSAYTSTDEDLTGLKAGDYDLEVTDDNGCTVTLATVTITQPPDLTVTLDSQIDITCHGDATGAINVTVAGGVMPTGGYYYSWTGTDYLAIPYFSNLQDLTGLRAGTYDLQVTDNNGCNETLATVTIVQPADLTVALDGQTNVLCHDDATGSILVTVAGGVIPAGGYDYAWTGTDYLGNPYAGTDEDPTLLKAGSYNLTVTDDSSCTVILPTVTITQPPDLTVSLVSQTNVLCHDDATGAIDVSVSGGVMPAGGYIYDWTGTDYLSNPYSSTDEDPSGLKAGTYDLEVTDDNGCTVILATVTITQPSDLTVSLTSQTNVLCHDANTGEIDVTAAGGVMPVGGYYYTWTGTDYLSNSYSNNIQDLTNLKAGTYDLTVKDANNCEVTLATVTITQPADLTVILDGQTNILCHDDAAGTISVTVAGGVMPAGGYDFAWTGTDYLGNPYTSTDEDLSGLKAGTYNLTVTDDNACFVVLPTVTVTQPPDLTVSLVSQTNILCHDDATGAIDVSVSGGVMPAGGYIYDWTGTDYLSNPYSSTDEDPSGLKAGTYDLEVTDDNGCTVVLATVTITQPADLTVSLTSQTNVLCHDANTGEIDVTAAGGVMPVGGYYYTWTGTDYLSNPYSNNIQDLTNLKAGTYNLTVKDANNCEVTLATVTITQPADLTVTLDGQTNILCHDDAAGTISVTVAGGVMPAGGYDFAWTGTDYLGNPFTSTDEDLTLLKAGTYDLTVTDDNACFVVLPTVTVTQPPDLTVSLVSQTNVLCHDDATGAINVTATGGVMPAGGYDYAWSGLDYLGNPFSSTNEDLSGIKAGTYDLTVTDDNGCAVMLATVTITQPADLTVTLDGQTNILCYGASTGAINITVTGGVEPVTGYRFAWTGTDYLGFAFASGNEDLVNLRAGTYDLEVSDNNFCTVTLATVTITQPTEMTSAITVPTDYFTYDVSCNGASDADIDLTPGGGAGGFTFAWTGPSGYTNNVDEDPQDVAAGFYEVTITDANGCTLADNVTVTEPSALSPGQVTGDQDVCYNGNPALLREAQVASGGPTTILYQWESGPTATGPWTAITGANANTYDPPANITATTFYRRAVTSGSCGPEYSNVLEVTVHPLPVAVVSGDTAICPGTSADIAIAVTTGTEPYIITVNNGVGLVSGYRSGDPITVSPFIAPVTYNLISIIDSFGCQVTSPDANITGSATVTFRETVSVATEPTNETICEGEDVSFSVVAQGEPPYSYQWYENNILMPGETGAALNLTNVPSTMNNNFYYVEVTGGCGQMVQSDFVFLTVRTNTVITTQPADKAVCENLATAFNVQATGSGLTYQWQEDDGVSGWQDLAESGQYVGVTNTTLNVFNVDSAMTGYRYRVNITGLCTALSTSDAAILTVNTSPLISANPVDATTCETVNTSFTVSAVGTGLTYKWQENSGSGFTDLAEGGTYTGTTAATLTINAPPATMNGNTYRVLVQGTCVPPKTSAIAQLTVNTYPAIVTHPISKEICEDGSVTFIAAASGTGITYHWQEDQGTGFADIADGGIYSGANSQALTLQTIPTTNDGYTYRLQIRGTCATINTSVADLIVNPNPTANITGDGDFPLVCGGLPLALNGNPAGGSGTYSSHLWTGDVFPLDVVTIQSPTFNTTASGDYNLTYTVTDSEGCQAKDLVTITNDRPNAQFVSNAKPECGMVTVDFTNQSSGAVAYEWNFDDPLDPGVVTDENPSHDFSNFTSQVYYYNTELVAFSSNGCADTARQIITVYPSIDATFTLDTTRGCNPLVVVMDAIPGGANYFWDYGDGNAENTGAQTAHQFNNTGTDPVTYTVSLTTTSFYGCTDNQTRDVTVYPLPTVNFTADPIIQVYPNATVNFNNLTPTGSWIFGWQLGDGAASTDYSPSHTYDDPGMYQVTLTATTALCADSVTHQITIEPAAPVAAFTQPVSGCAPLAIAFENNSLYGSSYAWDFGNGSSSFKENPTFTYYESGIYSVTLTVFGPGGTDNITQLVEVSTTPNAYTTVAPTFVFVNDIPVKCFNLTTDTAGVSYLWEFGDGDTSTAIEPIHVYQEPGRFDITLTATNSNGCSDSYTFSYVDVEPSGELLFPNVFRPNPNGPTGGEYVPGQDNNQVFFPGVYDQVIEYEMTIYNRWGEMIFISTDVNIGWDGYIEGKKLAEQGVYIWRVKGKYANGKSFLHVGDITLLR